MLSLNDLSLTLSKGTPLEKKIFNNLNLTLKAGEFVVILGLNGSGKTTLMNVISGITQPDSGHIIIDGQNFDQRLSREKANMVSKVMQDPKVGTMAHLTILENMAFAFKRGQRRGLHFFSTQKRISFFKDKLAQLNMGLEHRLNERVGNLSGGQRQVLSLVMCLLKTSKILLLDEITAALDPASSKMVMALTHKMVRSQNRTCVMITHNLSQALEYGDRILLLKEGQFIKEYNKMDKALLTLDELARQFDHPS